MGGGREGQALADGRLSGIDRRCWLRGDGLCVLREKARGLCRRRSSSSRGVLKRLIDRHSPSSKWILADLGVGWESHRITQMVLTTVMQQDRSVIN